jgi:hypothetical protein
MGLPSSLGPSMITGSLVVPPLARALLAMCCRAAVSLVIAFGGTVATAGAPAAAVFAWPAFVHTRAAR